MTTHRHFVTEPNPNDDAETIIRCPCGKSIVVDAAGNIASINDPAFADALTMEQTRSTKADWILFHKRDVDDPYDLIVPVYRALAPSMKFKRRMTITVKREERPATEEEKAVWRDIATQDLSVVVHEPSAYHGRPCIELHDSGGHSLPISPEAAAELGRHLLEAGEYALAVAAHMGERPIKHEIVMHVETKPLPPGGVARKEG